MAQKNRTTLKSYFQQGDIPTENEYIDLIDSFPSFNDPNSGSLGITGSITLSGSNGNLTASNILLDYSGSGVTGGLLDGVYRLNAQIIGSPAGTQGDITFVNDVDFNNQTLNNLTIGGGNINNTTIGVTSPAAGKFTTLTTIGDSAIGNSNDDKHFFIGGVTGSSFLIQDVNGSGTLRAHDVIIGDVGQGTPHSNSQALTISTSGSLFTSGSIVTLSDISASGLLSASNIHSVGTITSLGNISSSGTITGLSGIFGTGTTLINDNISASGDIQAQRISGSIGRFENIFIRNSTNTDTINLSSSIAVAIAGADELGLHTASLDLNMNSNSIYNVINITASGNISSSATGSFGMLIVDQNITASGNISSSGTIIGNKLIMDGGGVTTPSISFHGDSDTGISSPAANNVNINAGGSAGEINIIPNKVTVQGATVGGASFNVSGHITASGNISSSATGSFGMLIVDQNITASGNISASGTINTQILKVNDLTDGRVTLSSTNGRLADDSDLTFSNQTLTVTKIANIDTTHITASGDISSSGTITGNSIVGTIGTATQGTIDHDSLANFVANEHIDHSAVSVIAGTGLTGGGTIAANRTLNVIGGTGVTANANDIAIGQDVATTANVLFNHITASGNISSSGELSAATVSDVLAAAVVTQIDNDEIPIAKLAEDAVTVTAGTGLTGGGSITLGGSATVNVIGGTGVTANANDVAIGQDVATTANVLFNHISASGNISSSRNINVNEYISNGQPVAFSGINGLIIGNDNTNPISIGRAGVTPITLNGAVTASGNISSSGNITADRYISDTQTVAAAGSSISDATAIAATSGIIFVTTDDAAKGVKLPAVSTVAIGSTYTIHNTAASTALEIYPTANDKIFPLADDAPATLAASTAMVVTAFSADGYVGYFTTVIS
tara:strand:+ start:347 stop:3073 length:2727 start_codon:yes stop_codon:yes gene_type:complete